MQPMAGQDLLHTQPRPMHWLATATAISAVVAAASFVQPPDAKATTSPVAAAGPRPVAAPDPGKVTFPVDCGPNRLDVVKKASGDLDGDGTTETVAVVRCHSQTGTPPSGVYVLAQPSDPKAAPRIVATLLDPARRRTVQTLTVGNGAISAALLGYSTLDVPRCCPDVHRSVKWQWKGGKFVQSELPAAMSTQGL
ncbi:hypothetical protein SAMN05428945_3995 [Streptomyces sp. 2224.1]|nr:hypothetical protein BX261_1342 [Streptomyces sp. 2321.6]SDR54883.1 hypothetical protein SAMN05216511_5874 [Streptomyces sp. KS_16]SEC16465.1 hypothetical protein SAMN05428940_1342 [Streptomyces sp. 2133.1]SED15031.1 hypothetical protein SAMN05428945_3995 [Streptomyces sp. 2224.1]SEF07644.1 hypothetical protein SAMN05428954_5937 [Streptomyces sp. 2112.3]SNC65502.1 hypothetical protein SAMN06272741_1340 [Streptomyces sp. 2114.4]